MKALTICEPYASLIALPAADPRAKRVENRPWRTWYRGPLAIHAGKSRNWLEGDNYGFRLSELTFGAIIATAHLVECVPAVEAIDGAALACRLPGWVERKYGLAGHIHVEGPWCWVLESVRRLPTPVPCNGAQGLWNVPREIACELPR